MNTFSFTKENGTWYINLKNDLKIFNKSDFVLLEGSTPLLDYLSNEKKNITLAIDTIPFDKAFNLQLTQMSNSPAGGGYYELRDHRGRVIQEEVWLSDIPLFVFGDIPEHIYLRKEKHFSIQNIS
ncbi:hypothetical protein OCK74_18075 [Chitinophagaceae bacterium LB-8]|uniref:Uncharacterized protein n=1 Tax=Paraflavisolibacter caeni TaxID=2982496 RepID=A0A9X3BIB0_9BACT|nr:DUF6717 family protein [Paraflavisolibacter caeni]MCU7551032.1 hypothetical protein [Paraflavisolibacter caeni]